MLSQPSRSPSNAADCWASSRCAESDNPAHCGGAGAVLQCGVEIIELKISAVVEDLRIRHSRRKEIKDELDDRTE